MFLQYLLHDTNLMFDFPHLSQNQAWCSHFQSPITFNFCRQKKFRTHFSYMKQDILHAFSWSSLVYFRKFACNRKKALFLCYSEKVSHHDENGQFHLNFSIFSQKSSDENLFERREYSRNSYETSLGRSQKSQHFPHNDTWWICRRNPETVVSFFTKSVCSLFYGVLELLKVAYLPLASRDLTDC